MLAGACAPAQDVEAGTGPLSRTTQVADSRVEVGEPLRVNVSDLTATTDTSDTEATGIETLDDGDLGTTVVAAAVADSVVPARVELELESGQTAPSINKTITVPPTPSDVEICTVVDLSGSFRDDLVNLKAQSSAITAIVDAASSASFGLAYFADHPVPPHGSAGDAPYVLQSALTDADSWQRAVDALVVGAGGDFPESQLDAIWGAVNGLEGWDPSCGFSEGTATTKIVIATTDAVCHEPGAGKPHQHSTDEVQQTLVDNGIVFIGLQPSFLTNCFQPLAEATGGVIQDLRTDGSNITAAIRAAIGDVLYDIVPTPDPASCQDLELGFDPPSHADVANGETVSFVETVRYVGTTDEPVTCTVSFAPAGQQTIVVNPADSVLECPDPDSDNDPGTDPDPDDPADPDDDDPDDTSDGSPGTDAESPEVVTLTATDFGDIKLWASRPDRRRSQAAELPDLTGVYRIELGSSDETHDNPDMFTQPLEQWLLVGFDRIGNEVFRTVPSADLPDDIVNVTTDVGFYDLTDVVSVEARHAWPAGGNPNSIRPVSVRFTPAPNVRKLERAAFGEARLLAPAGRSTSIPVSDLSGEWQVELYSEDAAHPQSRQRTQRHEEWKLVGLDADGTVIIESGLSADIPDRVVGNRTLVGSLDLTGVVAVQARHGGDTSSANSVDPVGVAFMGDVETGDGVRIVDLSPRTGDVVTAPIDIDATLDVPPGTTVEEWRTVAYESSSCVERGVELASGSGNPSDGFGRFDPTVLPNGTWVIRLEVSDDRGEVSVRETVVTVEGGLKQGRLALVTADTSIATGGRMPLVVSRTYDTLRRNVSTDFGFGWTLGTIDYRISSPEPLGGGDWIAGPCPESIDATSCTLPTEPRFVSVVWPDGRVETFDLVATGSAAERTVTYVGREGTTSELRPVEVDDRVTVSGTGSLVGPEGSPYQPNQFTLAATDGMEYLIDRDRGLTRSTDSNGVSITYGPGGFVSSLGPELVFERDEQGRITSVVEPGGSTVRYTYDGAGDLVVLTDQSGNETRFTYDSGHRLLTVDDPSPGIALTVTYNAEGRVTTVAGPDAEAVVADDDVDARVTTTTSTDGQLVTRTTYDDRGNPVEIDGAHDGRRTITTLEYDDNDNVTRRTDAEGNTWSGTYNANHDLTSFTDPAGNTKTFTYDAAGRPETITDADGSTIAYEYDAAGNVVSITDGRGGIERFTYDDRGNQLSRTDQIGRTEERRYDAQGRIVEAVDPRGNVTSYEYDSVGRLTGTTAPDGGVTSYQYDAVGNLLSTTDPLGRETRHTYDSGNLLTSTTDPSGATTAYTYDGAGRMLTATDPTGRTATYEYEFDRLVASTAPDGGVTTYTYDGAGRVRSFTDPIGRTTTYGYDAVGRRTSVAAPSGRGETAVSTTTYDESGRVAATTNAEGETSTFAYDALGRLSSVTDPIGRVDSYRYDPAGNRVSWENGAGETTTWTYDLAGQLTSVTDPAGGTTSYRYDEAGNVISTTDPVGRETTNSYDSVNRLVSTTSPSGATAETTYDLAGQAVETTTRGGVTTAVSYDPRGLITSITNELGNTTRSTFDAAGRVLSRTDGNGNTTSFDYDPNGRLASETDALGGVVTFGYDLAGQRISVTDPNGAVRETEYDDAGQIVTETDAEGRTTMNEYDAAQRLVRTTDARGVAVSFAYDDAGQLVGAISPNEVRSFQYDGAGRQIGWSDSSGSSAATYDAAGRVTSVVSAAGTVSYGYNAAGDRISMTQPQGTVTTGYDQNGFVSLIEDWRGDTITMVNDPDGRVLTAERSSGVGTAYGYDDAGRLTRLTHTAGSDVVDEFVYELDGNGHRVAVTSNDGAERYNLDALNRIVDATYPGGVSEAFTYDAAGNRIGHTRTDGTTIGYTVDRTGRLVSDTTGTTYSYDAAGNLTSTSAGESYLYDDYGRTVEATRDGTTQTFIYDAAGVRVAVDDVSQLWDRTDLQTLIATGDGASFVHGPSGVLREGDNWLLADAVGSVRSTVNPAGDVASVGYTAFGETLSGSPGIFGFAGEQLDPTGQIHLRARQYNPWLGRFTSVDPIQPGAPGTTGWNLYAYAGNNPTTWTDPSGMVLALPLITLLASVSLKSLITAALLAILATIVVVRFYEVCLASGSGCSFDLPSLGSSTASTAAPTVDPPVPLSPEQLTEVAEAIRGKIGTLTEEAAKAIAATCAGVFAANLFVDIADPTGVCKGDFDPVYFAGSADLPDINAHITSNLATRPQNVRLNYRGPKNGHGRGWLRSTTECKNKTRGFFCDEFPFASVDEGGQANYPTRVTLLPIDPKRNGGEGGRLGGFYSSCLGDTRGSFFVSPTPTSPAVPTFYVGPGCSGPASVRGG